MGKLKRTLDFKMVLLLTINAIMGTGIFFLPAVGASHAGPASLISWGILSAIAVLISMYFAELVSMFPSAGGVYEYTKQAFGKFPSFLVGWVSWIIANITTAMLIVGGIQYIIPEAAAATKILVSLFFIIGFNYVSYRGMKVSAALLVVFSVATLLVLLSLIVPGLFDVSLSNFDPFFVAPLPAIYIAIFFIAETFFGWETTTFLAEETKNPRKNLPKALIMGTSIVALISITLSFTLLGLFDWQVIGQSTTPLTDMALNLFGPIGEIVFLFGIFFVIMGAAAAWIVSSPRLLMAMSRDKLFFSAVSKVHKKHKTPYNAIILQTVIASIIMAMGFGSYQTLLELLVPLVLIMYSVVMANVIKLRISDKDKKLRRYFHAPFPIIGPSLIILFNLTLIGIWMFTIHGAANIFSLGIAFIVLGIPSYFGVRLIADKKFAEKFYDKFYLFWDKLFPLWYGKNEKEKVIASADVHLGSQVLDYGAYTGMTTEELSTHVGDEGTVVAVDISQKGLEYAQFRLEDKENVILVKEENIVPFKKNTFDAITLVSMIEHMEHPIKEMKTLHKILKKDGRISVLSFGKSFGVPAPYNLKNEKRLKSLFERAGFRNIEIERKRKLFSEMFFISGEK